MARAKAELEEIANAALELSKRGNLEPLYFNIGVTEFYKTARPGIKASANYDAIGRAFVDKQIKRLQEALCNQRAGKPRAGVENSDWAVIAAAALHDLAKGTVIAIIAIAIRHGLAWLCRYKPPKLKPASKPKPKAAKRKAKGRSR